MAVRKRGVKSTVVMRKPPVKQGHWLRAAHDGPVHSVAAETPIGHSRRVRGGHHGLTVQEVSLRYRASYCLTEGQTPRLVSGRHGRTTDHARTGRPDVKD